ncbi:MAG: hypothetical protein AUH14_06465 [Candidatus Rokubacteria bacterium 13_2_20CM_69_15_1]|nr:MAG: hypothetical protein AUH14_06465 [Candidatus Rokubacteria bacterium 13_2_20CM_69_15_1]
MHADLAPVLHVPRAVALPEGRRAERTLAASPQRSEEGEIPPVGGLGLLVSSTFGTRRNRRSVVGAELVVRMGHRRERSTRRLDPTVGP